jgi:hypothetical protein
MWAAHSHVPPLEQSGAFIIAEYAIVSLQTIVRWEEKR